MSNLSFDLIVGSIGRHSRLRRLFRSLAAQEYSDFRVIVVEQRDEVGTRDLVREFDDSFEGIVVSSALGLSRARNVGLSLANADVLAFPDDDCWYEASTLGTAARMFSEGNAEILIGQQLTESGTSVIPTPRVSTPLGRNNVWAVAMSSAIFVGHAAAARVGPFDEALGVGSGTPWQSGEETDWILRMLTSGASGVYYPNLIVRHPTPDETAGRMSPTTGLGYGRGMGAVMRRHNYPRSAIARAVVRPFAGSIAARLRGDQDLARFRYAASKGRAQGWRTGLPE